ncbi:MAG: response regulator [Vulcanimicrobiota bacterium]
MRVLLVDDDDTLRQVLGDYLESKNIEVKLAASGAEALETLTRETFDLMVLDVMMPQMDGLEVLQRTGREYPSLSVIMLTAVGDEPDRILGLEMGADDYLVKPVSPRELLAHIKALSRRRDKAVERKLSSTPLEIDYEKREACLSGKPLELTSAEYALLAILFKNKGIVLARERLMDLARGKEFIAFDRSIDVHISHLRQKLGDDPKSPRIIKTIRGAGYIFTG